MTQHWLWLGPDDDFPLIGTHPSSFYTNYPINAEGVALMTEWQNTDYDSDQIISGVLADWLEENQSDLLAGAIHKDNEVRLWRTINHLRTKCFAVASPECPQ